MKATRKVSQKAQQMANVYVESKGESIREGSEFEIYANGRFYTFSFQNRRGHWAASFEHYGRK